MRMMVPNVISRYLLTMAAMMSVPPILPFDDKAKPTPAPHSEPPRMVAING